MPINTGGHVVPLLSWTNELSVKIAAFDTQHQSLFRLINELHEAMRSGKGATAIGETLDKLLAYTETHFHAEETVMKRWGYPGAAAHSAQHSVLTAKVRQFSNDMKTGKAVLSVEVMDFLQNWLRQHILGTDKQYSNFLNQQGVK